MLLDRALSTARIPYNPLWLLEFFFAQRVGLRDLWKA